MSVYLAFTYPYEMSLRAEQEGSQLSHETGPLLYGLLYKACKLVCKLYYAPLCILLVTVLVVVPAAIRQSGPSVGLNDQVFRRECTQSYRPSPL